jgi:hypothetical protein
MKKRIRQFILSDKTYTKPMFQYKKDGIYFIGKGIYTNINLSIHYITDSEGVENLIDNILDYDGLSYKQRANVYSVLHDLKNNYMNYEDKEK